MMTGEELRDRYQRTLDDAAESVWSGAEVAVTEYVDYLRRKIRQAFRDGALTFCDERPSEEAIDASFEYWRKHDAHCERMEKEAAER